nr:uncharacterized protein LOC104100666 [Nicotiana tomentosiformis]
MKQNIWIKRLKWDKPELSELKLNTDGCFKDNPGQAGGGGILRDHMGDVVMAFSHYYGICSNNEAEGSIKANWQLQETISKIRRLMEHGQFAINHCYREINMAADTLTNLGVLNKYRTIFNMTVSMPT